MAKCTVTIYVDYSCLERIETAARQRGVSRGEVIREALEALFPAPPAPSTPPASSSEAPSV